MINSALALLTLLAPRSSASASAIADLARIESQIGAAQGAAIDGAARTSAASEGEASDRARSAVSRLETPSPSKAGGERFVSSLGTSGIASPRSDSATRTLTSIGALMVVGAAAGAIAGVFLGSPFIGAAVGAGIGAILAAVALAAGAANITI